MKKIFTLLISIALFSSAFAQQERGRNTEYDHRHKNEDNRYGDHYSFGNRERDMQIMNINRTYDHKIWEVNNKLFMNRFKKSRIIDALEAQRRDELKKVYANFNYRDERYNDRDSKKRW